jgi:hypothetical protein
MDFYSVASTTALTPAEKKTVEAARARIKSAEAFAIIYGAPGLDGEVSHNQRKIAELAEAFKSKPSAEIAAEIAQAATLHELSKAISAHFGGICSDLRRQISRELLPLAESLTQRAIEALDQQLTTGAAALEKVGGLADAAADLRAKHARQTEIARHEVAENTDGERDTLRWIVNNFAV